MCLMTGKMNRFWSNSYGMLKAETQRALKSQKIALKSSSISKEYCVIFDDMFIFI